LGGGAGDHVPPHCELSRLGRVDAVRCQVELDRQAYLLRDHGLVVRLAHLGGPLHHQQVAQQICWLGVRLGHLIALAQHEPHLLVSIDVPPDVLQPAAQSTRCAGIVVWGERVHDECSYRGLPPLRSREYVRVLTVDIWHSWWLVHLLQMLESQYEVLACCSAPLGDRSAPALPVARRVALI